MTLLDQGRHESCRSGRPAVLTTQRLRLRAPRAADAKPVASLLNDRVADAQAFLAASNRDPAAPSFLITLTDGTLVGGCGIEVSNGRDPELGFWIAVPHWGRGYATEAARALIDHAFGALGCAQLAGRARVSNPASRRVLEKCGFQWTGVALIRIRALKSSAPVDCFRLDRGLWASLRSWGSGSRHAGEPRPSEPHP
jgi:GNAT superfamily N-acetyltransferase